MSLLSQTVNQVAREYASERALRFVQTHARP